MGGSRRTGGGGDRARVEPPHAQWTVYDPANYVENALQYTHQLMQIKYQLEQFAVSDPGPHETGRALRGAMSRDTARRA